MRRTNAPQHRAALALEQLLLEKMTADWRSAVTIAKVIGHAAEQVRFRLHRLYRDKHLERREQPGIHGIYYEYRLIEAAQLERA